MSKGIEAESADAAVSILTETSAPDAQRTAFCFYL